jgi:hypothetical protein
MGSAVIDPGIKRGIGTGLVVWLICWILLRPLLEFLGSRLFSMEPGLISFVIDPIYRQAALGDRNVAGTTIMLMGAGGSLGLAVGLIAVAVRARKRGNLGDVSAPRPTSTGLPPRSFIAFSVVFALGFTWLAVGNDIALT